MKYVAPWWLPGGHAQTIWPALGAHTALPGLHLEAVRYWRERWDTPDGDFIDLDWLATTQATPLLALFHGLEGSSRSHYALAFAVWARQQGLGFVVPHFRGCSGEINRAPRAYHSGDYEEVDWILQRLRASQNGPLLAVGVSLGGNALLRWAEEAGETAGHCVAALASVSAPVDLAASAHAIGRGLNRHIYTRRFLRTMKPRALQKLAQFPGLFDEKALRAARDLHAFDDVFTAPLHGFKDAQDYWQRASAKPHLARIKVPTLVVNARNDPFVPATSLPHAQQVGRYVTLWQPAGGGHVGFAQGRPPGHLQTLPQQVGGWLRQLELAGQTIRASDVL